MLSVLAVDDEPSALAQLTDLLRADTRVERVLAAREPARALRDVGRLVVSGERLDGVFLDIRMPDLDGLDFARLLGGFAHPPPVVFVTAREDYAVPAFELGAIDYLLKPVRPERLAEAVRRVDEVVRRDPETARRGAEAPSLDDEAETIPVELAGRVLLVPLTQVRYAEAQGDYVRIHTADGGSYLLRTSLQTLARRWRSAGFVRIHRSTLVSARHISELRRDDGRFFVQVAEHRLQVSRRLTPSVRDLLVRRFHQDVDA